MARALTGTLPAQVASTITTPAWLVEIAFSMPLRLSSRGDQSWDGQAWTGGRLGKVALSESSGGLEIINTDLAAGALAMNEGVADRPVKVWAFYGDNPTDVIAVFDGVGDGVEVGPDRIRITLQAENRRALFSPRRFIGPSAGFNRLIPAGTRISWGGQTITLER